MIELMVRNEKEKALREFSARLLQAAKDKGLPVHGLGVAIAKALDITPRAVGKYINAEAKPGSANMERLAKFLGVDLAWLALGVGQPGGIHNQLTEFEILEPWDSSTPLDDDEVEAPFFTDVEMAAGHGRIPVRENGGPKLRFSKSTLRRHHVEPALIACAKVSGNSMEPAIPDGATIGIDTGKTEIKDGDIFAVSHQDELRVKLLYKLPGQLVRLRSFNSDEWPEEIYPASDIKVLGRVFWWSVLR